MNTVDWIAHSPCWLAAAVRGFANYGLSLSSMPCMVPIGIDPPAQVRGGALGATAAARLQAGCGDGAKRR